MSRWDQYTDSVRAFNANTTKNDALHWSEETRWQQLSSAVDALKRKVERAYYMSNDEEAGQAHDDLTSAERRLRMAERARS